MSAIYLWLMWAFGFSAGANTVLMIQLLRKGVGDE